MLQVTGTDRQLSSDAGILSLLSEAKVLAFVSALCRKILYGGGIHLLSFCFCTCRKSCMDIGWD
jgi:hypothetical protein